ncbi:MAG: alpha/beta hydrolase [Alphaproteobacteria bacterium]|nr:alpha/beta hydrolase [Alphaproteobacteria bacterium]
MELSIDGKSAFIATGGRPFDPDKPALVLVHGAGMDHTVWSMQARFFAHHGFSVMNLDLPGHGRSAGPAPTTISDYTDWLASVIDKAGARDVHLIGHSMGSLISMSLAAWPDGGVEKLALLGTLPHIQVADGLLSAAKANDHSAYESIVGWGVGRHAQMGGHRAPGSWIAGTSLRLLEAGLPGVLANDLGACHQWEAGLEMAGKITCPTLLLLGAGDRMTPARGAKPLEEAIADCRTTVLANAGHMMMAEQPEETLDALAGFFSKG